MELELGPQRQFSRKMTDRERREALDRIIQNHYPAKTPEEIHQIREEYITAHYGKGRNFLPQPERKYRMGMERTEAAPPVETTRPTVPEEDRITIPEPEYFFGVEELVFEKFPEEALRAYYDLLADKYGFVLEYPDFSLDHSNFLTYGETDTYDIAVLLFRAPNDGLIRIQFWTDDYHRLKKLETWGGDITPYLYDPDHWEECSTCSGTDRCQECWGTGEVDTGGGYDINRERCQDCDGKGKCPNCYGGQRLKPKSWDELTTDEKIETDWQRFSAELFEEK